MKIYDISQEVYGCRVFPGDIAPQKEELMRMTEGSLYNLSSLYMCVHNGTHVDAPYHFINDGKKIDEVSPEHYIGRACVTEHEGIVTAEDARRMLAKARQADARSAKRLLIKGDAIVSADAARVFAEAKLLLVGNESQTVGPADAPREVHLILLGAEVVLLEGICLAQVPEGVYLLNAAPLLLAGSDGAPCRAILIADGEIME